MSNHVRTRSADGGEDVLSTHPIVRSHTLAHELSLGTQNIAGSPAGGGVSQRSLDGLTQRFEEEEEALDAYVRRLFGGVLEETLGADFKNKVFAMYTLGEEYNNERSRESLQKLADSVRKLKKYEAILVASAFSNMVNLHNISEEVSASHENRYMRTSKGNIEGQPRTSNAAVKELVQAGVSPEEIYSQFANQTVELVFTAHPTQAVRRSLLRIYNDIRTQLTHVKRVRLSTFEMYEVEQKIVSLMQAAWRTDEIRRGPPTPQDEMRAGLSYVQEVIFDALPIYLRRLDSALHDIGMPPLPLNSSTFKFSSWMGGDRDGNPFVTASCTREVVTMARLSAMNIYFKKIEQLMFDLSMWRCTKEFEERVQKVLKRHEGYSREDIAMNRKRRNYSDFWQPIPDTQPYRVILAEIRDKLWSTRDYLQRRLDRSFSNSENVGDILSMDVYVHVEELLEPLEACYKSLCETKDEKIANGHLRDVIRQIRCFGLNLICLDIRQESERHMMAMNAITQYMGIGSYKEWDEAKKIEFLTKELEGRRPLLGNAHIEADEEAEEVLETFRAVAELTRDFPGSLGAYVISMSTCASDVLCVKLLMRDCGCSDELCLRVSPLFERLDDLNNAPGVMNTLFSNKWYLNHIKGFQEVMIGYSDSGKDAGRLAAAWALYEGQEKITEVANKFDVKLTLFHGRGGTVGRGGGPSHLGILSQPPRTIDGRLRVTVQGEVIEQAFANQELAFRTFDLYSAAVALHSLEPPATADQMWRDRMAKLASDSCDEYRRIVFQDPDFIKYFNEATPAQELARLNIGSRPSKRKNNMTVTSLRAIPWIFSWTQTRFNLPVWLGVGKALKTLWDEGHGEDLRAMYRDWPFFKVTVDMLEMVLAKSEKRIAQLYEDELVDPSLHGFGKKLGSSYDETLKMLLQVTSHDALLTNDDESLDDDGFHYQDLLKHRLDMRAPYIVPLNVLQAICLKDVRKAREEGFDSKSIPKDELDIPEVFQSVAKLNPNVNSYLSCVEDTMQITIKGIASGLQNTG